MATFLMHADGRGDLIVDTDEPSEVDPARHLANLQEFMRRLRMEYADAKGNMDIPVVVERAR